MRMRGVCLSELWGEDIPGRGKNLIHDLEVGERFRACSGAQSSGV